MGKFWAGLAAVGLIVVVAYLLGYIGQHKEEPMSPERQSVDFAVRQASVVCLSGVSETSKREIGANTTAQPSGVKVGGTRTEQHDTQYAGQSMATETQIEGRKDTQDCLAAQVPLILAMTKGLDPSSLTAREKAAASRGGVDAAIANNPKISSGAIGFIYYEEDQGNPTDDGVFSPRPQAPSLPHYANIKVGDILQSAKGSQLRQTPDTKYPPIRTLPSGQCVRVLEPPKSPIINLMKATSGGRIKVQAISC